MTYHSKSLDLEITDFIYDHDPAYTGETKLSRTSNTQTS